MKIAGVVAEYNPFHSGHGYHLAETRRRLGEESGVVCAMSGNWVQRGECAVADKWTRTQLALQGGADLVLELPTVWAISSAEGFAQGGVTLLAQTGVVDVLSFGSEAGDLSKLEAAARCLNGQDYPQTLRKKLEEGISFAAARQAAVEELAGPVAECIAQPNNNLAVEYLRVLERLGGPIAAMTVMRKGASHDAPGEEEGFRSASALRALLWEGNFSEAARYLPPGGAERLRQEGLARLEQCERAVLARLKIMSREEFSKLPDSGEGLANRLYEAARQCRSLEELYTLAKTKRYAHARIRRMVLWAFLGLTRADRPQSPPYLRVLGLNGRGRQILRRMEGVCPLPILTKPAHWTRLPKEEQTLFEAEARCTDLYNLCRGDLSRAACGMEYTRSPVVTE